MDTHRKDYIMIWTALSPGPTHRFPCLSWQPDLANKGRKGLRNKPKSPEGAWPSASSPLLPLVPLGCGPKDTVLRPGLLPRPHPRSFSLARGQSLEQETHTLKKTYLYFYSLGAGNQPLALGDEEKSKCDVLYPWEAPQSGQNWIPEPPGFYSGGWRPSSFWPRCGTSP